MAAEILRRRLRLAHNRSGANLLSGVASTLLAAGDAELGLLEVDEAALPEVMRRVRPRAVCLGNLFRDQLDRYGELELVAARWRDGGGGPPGGDHARRQRRRPAGRRPRECARGRRRLRSRRPPRRAPGAAACGRLEVLPAVRDAVRVRRGLRRPSRRLPLPELRPRAPRPRRRRAKPRAARARAGRRSTSTSRARRAASSSRCPASTTSTTPSAPPRSRMRSARRLDEIVAGLGRFTAAFGRFERIAVGEKTLLLLLIKNPAGANEAIRTLVDGGPPRLAVVALNDAIADGRDVSWIWDVDFEPLLAGLDRLVAIGRPRGRARAPLQVRRRSTSARSRSSRARAGARPRPRADAGRRRARRPPHLHRDARPAAHRRRARPRAAVLGACGVTTIRVGHLYPDYLNIYADRGNIAVLARARGLARAHARGRRDRDGRRDRAGRARPLLPRRRAGPRAAARGGGPRRRRRSR